MKSAWGDPLIAVRMPKPVIQAVKRMAWDEKTTLSSLIRNIVMRELEEKGYAIKDEPIDGQTTFDE